MNHLQNRRCSTTKGELAKKEGGSDARGGEIKGDRPQIRYRRVGVRWAPLQHLSAHLDTLQLYIYTFFISLLYTRYELIMTNDWVNVNPMAFFRSVIPAERRTY